MSRPRSITRALAALLALGAAACGGDGATAPARSQSLTTADALASLARGFPGGASTLPTGSSVALGDLATIPPAAVGQASVTVDGSAQTMYAFASRTVFPPGTCLEHLIAYVGGSAPAGCTSPPGGLMLVLWQAHAATAVPDRAIIVIAELGAQSFADPFQGALLGSSGGSFPPVALYLEQGTNVSIATAGSLTSAVAAASGSCTPPRSAFIASATCALATFAESGTLSFSALDLAAGRSSATHTVTINGAAIPGIVTTVTAIAATR